MSSLDRSDGRSTHWPLLVVGAAAFVAGVAFVGIGALSMAYTRLVEALGPHEGALWAITVAGLGLSVTLSVIVFALGGREEGRAIGLGLASSAVGIALVWLLVSPSWTGALSTSLLPGAVLYAAGLFSLVVRFVGVAMETSLGTPTTTGATVSYQRTSNAPGNASFADGGADDDDGLSFPLDSDDDERE